MIELHVFVTVARPPAPLRCIVRLASLDWKDDHRVETRQAVLGDALRDVTAEMTRRRMPTALKYAVVEALEHAWQQARAAARLPSSPPTFHHTSTWEGRHA